MYDLLSILAGLVLGVGILVLIARFLEHRAKTEGPLFTKPPSAIARVVALVLAALLAAAFVSEATLVGRYHIVFPILALALAGYGFGVHSMVASIQRATDVRRQAPESPKNVPPDV